MFSSGPQGVRVRAYSCNPGGDRRWARRIASAASLAVVVGVTANAHATLKVLLGPGAPATPTGTALRFPFFNTYGGLLVSNNGIATIGVQKYVNGSSAGNSAVIYSNGVTSELSTIASGSGVLNPGAISADGYVGATAAVVSGTTALGTRAVRYAPGQTTGTPLGMPSGTLSSTGVGNVTIGSVNTGGGIGGTVDFYSGTTTLGSHGIVWNPGSTTGSLRLPATTGTGGMAYSAVYALNDGGTAGGTATRYATDGTDLGSRPVRWAANSTTGAELAVPTATPTGTKEGYVLTLNSGGTAAGTVNQYDGDNFQGERPARWESGGSAITVLGTLGVDVNGSINRARVLSINDAGTSTGYVTKYVNGASVGTRAVRWDAGTANATELGTLFTGTGVGPGDTISYGTHVNGMGVIGGYSYVTTSIVHAALWLPGTTTPLDLNTLIPAGDPSQLQTVYSLSDTGYVTGQCSYDPDGAGGVPAYQRFYTMLVPQAGTYGSGDANFDTAIDFSDLLILAKNYGSSNRGSINVGDFDLNGVTDFNDLLTLAKHYGTPSAAAVLAATGDDAFTGDWALAQALVPEPCVAGVAACGVRATPSLMGASGR